MIEDTQTQKGANAQRKYKHLFKTHFLSTTLLAYPQRLLVAGWSNKTVKILTCNDLGRFWYLEFSKVSSA